VHSTCRAQRPRADLDRGLHSHKATSRRGHAFSQRPLGCPDARPSAASMRSERPRVAIEGACRLVLLRSTSAARTVGATGAWLPSRLRNRRSPSKRSDSRSDGHSAVAFTITREIVRVWAPPEPPGVKGHDVQRDAPVGLQPPPRRLGRSRTHLRSPDPLESPGNGLSRETSQRSGTLRHAT
jgi:hypothetical protein